MDINNYISDYNKNNELLQLITQLKNEIAKIDEQIKNIDNSITKIVFTSIDNTLPKKKSFFEKLFGKKKKNTNNENDWNNKDEITQLLSTKETLLKQKNELLSKLNVLNEEQSKLNLKPYLEIKNGQPIISGSKTIDTSPLKDISETSIREMKDKIAIVHCTNYFPKDKTIVTNYDGNKHLYLTIGYDDVNKECQTISHRHTTHFTLNRRVENTGDGRGFWNNPKFIIVDSLSKYIDNFVCLCTSDSFTYQSLKLTGKPIMLVREDCLNEIPNEERSNYQIVLYEGDPSNAIKNFLDSQGFSYFDGDPNSVTHSQSIYYKVEKTLEKRDLLVNYIRNNTYNGKEKIELTVEEINEMYKIFNNNSAFDNSFLISYDASEIGIPIEYANFIINFGIIPSSNGKFTFDTDENILATFVNHKTIDINSVKAIYNLMISNKSIEYSNIEASPNMLLQELYDIKNHTICKNYIYSLLSKEIVSLVNKNIKNFQAKYIEKKDDGLYLLICMPANIYDPDIFKDTELVNSITFDEPLIFISKKIADSSMTLMEVENSFTEYINFLLLIQKDYLTKEKESRSM